jgi:hypothetical protein
LAVVEVDPHLIVGDVETDLLIVFEVDPHLDVGDVEEDIWALAEVDFTLLLIMLRNIS